MWWREVGDKLHIWWMHDIAQILNKIKTNWSLEEIVLILRFTIHELFCLIMSDNGFLICIIFYQTILQGLKICRKYVEIVK